MTDNHIHEVTDYGPSLIDLAAIAAMQSLMTNPLSLGCQSEQVARSAYRIADALRAERQKRLDACKEEA